MSADPVYQTPLYKEAMQAVYRTQSARWPHVQRLYAEPLSAIREQVYANMVPLNPELFGFCQRVFAERHRYAVESGRASMLHWSREQEEDLIDWKVILSDATLVESVLGFSSAYAEQRKRVLGLERFRPWDFWLQTDEEKKLAPHFLMLADSHEACVEIMKRFMAHFGFAEIFERINWIKNEKQTLARINIDDNRLITSIALSESSSQTSVGSLSYLGIIAHELGHVLQARLNERPTEDNLAPPHLLREVVSMFLQKLFLCELHLNELLAGRPYPVKAVLDHILFEDNETLVRLMCHLEFEIKAYDLMQEGSFNPASLSHAWKECQKKFFGFEEEYAGEDHTWQGGSYYLVYHPFYNRSYIIGEVLGRVMLRKFLNDINRSLESPGIPETFSRLVAACSSRGVANSWPDYMAACNIPHLNSITLKNELIRCLIGMA